MKVRIVDHTGETIVEGNLNRAWTNRPSGAKREVTRVLENRMYSSSLETPGWGSANVQLEAPQALPLWHGGTFVEQSLDFTLPSGFHNVWGCGNDFDTDAFRIHPQDIWMAMLLSLTDEERAEVLKISPPGSNAIPGVKRLRELRPGLHLSCAALTLDALRGGQ